MIIEGAIDAILFFNIWQEMLIETLAGLWIQKLYEFCGKTQSSIDKFINDKAADIFKAEVKKLIQLLPDSEQQKLKRFGINKAVAKIFGTLKPLNEEGAIWYSTKYLLRNKHLIIQETEISQYMSQAGALKFISFRNAPFNNLQQKDYDYLFAYIQHAETDKSGEQYFYPPQQYLEAHIQFWKDNFSILSTSMIVNSGKGLSTQDAFIPANVLCFYSGYLYFGSQDKLSCQQLSRALILKKNKVYIIACTLESPEHYPSFMNFYFVKKGNKRLDYNHFRIVERCHNQKGEKGKNGRLGFIESQIDLQPNTECFLNYANTYNLAPVQASNQVQFSSLMYDVQNKALCYEDQTYVPRYMEFMEDRSQFYKSLHKRDLWCEGLDTFTSTLNYSLTNNYFLSPLLRSNKKEETAFTEETKIPEGSEFLNCTPNKLITNSANILSESVPGINTEIEYQTVRVEPKKLEITHTEQTIGAKTSSSSDLLKSTKDVFINSTRTSERERTKTNISQNDSAKLDKNNLNKKSVTVRESSRSIKSVDRFAINNTVRNNARTVVKPVDKTTISITYT